MSAPAMPRQAHNVDPGRKPIPTIKKKGQTIIYEEYVKAVSTKSNVPTGGRTPDLDIANIKSRTRLMRL